MVINLLSKNLLQALQAPHMVTGKFSPILRKKYYQSYTYSEIEE